MALAVRTPDSRLDASVSVDPCGPEAGILNYCIRRACGSATRGEACEAARRNPDWMRLLAFSRLHGVTPLLRAGLEGMELPDAAAVSIRAGFQRSAAGGFLLAGELVRLHDALRLDGVQALAFKGPALAMRAFGKISLRQCRDVDLLVEREHVEPALRALRRAGYAQLPSSFGVESEKHACLENRENGARAELHWAVSRPSFAFQLPFERLWKRREYVSVLDAQVAAPHPEDLLLMLSAHGASHCWASLKWVCDIAALLERCPEIDWPRFMAEARQAGGLRMALVGLALARDAAGAILPNAVAGELSRDAAALRIARETRERIFAGAARVENEQRAFAYIRSRERLRDRTRIALAYVTPKLRPTARERALLPLPRWLQFLYWPFRLARLLAAYSREIGKPMLASLADR
jgi:hypothetical protein